MNTLHSYLKSLVFILLCITATTHSMEPENNNQLIPITWAQTYHELSEILPPDVMPLIFSFHVYASGIDYANLHALIKKSCTSPKSFIDSLTTLLKSDNYNLAAEIFERGFAYTQVSICDIKDGHGWNVLYETLINANTVQLMKIILKIADTKTWTLLTQTHGCRSILSCAVGNGEIKTVKFLLDFAGDKAQELMSVEPNGKTTLHVAAIDQQLEVAKLLIQTAGDNAWTFITKQFGGTTALHIAADRRQSTMIELLLDTAGTKAQELIAIPDKNGKTVLDWATPEMKKVIETYLLRNQTNHI